jgi:hypothetical protein
LYGYAQIRLSGRRLPRLPALTLCGHSMPLL